MHLFKQGMHCTQWNSGITDLRIAPQSVVVGNIGHVKMKQNQIGLQTQQGMP